MQEPKYKIDDIVLVKREFQKGLVEIRQEKIFGAYFLDENSGWHYYGNCTSSFLEGEIIKKIK